MHLDKRFSRLTLSFLLAVIGTAGFGLPAGATPLAITNADFEDFVLSGPGDFSRQQGGFENGTGTVSPDAVPGWTTTPLDSNASTGTFWDDARIVTSGVNVAYVATVTPGTGFTALEQTLPSVLTANTIYTLEVDVSHGAVDYRIELRAGGIVLAEDDNSLSGTFYQTSTLTYESGSSDPGLGAPLIISLQGGPSPGAAALFDTVRLDATPIPEPGTALLLGLGLVGLACRRRD